MDDQRDPTGNPYGVVALWSWARAARRMLRTSMDLPTAHRSIEQFAIPPGRPDQAELLMKAAGHHLDRVGKLADTEWKVSLAFWAAMIASGASIISVAGGGETDLAYLVYANASLILIAYLAGVAIFVFGFSSNQSQSISTERNRFLTYQAAALTAANVASDLIILPALPLERKSPLEAVTRPQTRYSTVWVMKLASSTAFAFMITGVSVTMAGVRASEWRFASWQISTWIIANFLVATVIALLWLEMTVRLVFRARFARA